MIKIKITSPTKWHEQCMWIESNCKNWIDETEWAAWQVGISDIYFWLEEEDAILFRLVWGKVC